MEDKERPGDRQQGGPNDDSVVLWALENAFLASGEWGATYPVAPKTNTYTVYYIL